MFGKKNIVIFAAGGGNDVFSSIAYIKAHLCNYNFDNIAIVSVLGFTPFHSNDIIKENVINVEYPLIIPTSNMKRYLPYYTPLEISCSERLLPDMLKQLAPEIKNYVCMSPKYSAVEQSDNLLKLFSEWNMLPDDTLLNIVDFGGDILTDGTPIISPELDAYTLAVVQNLSKTYLSKISICFPGVDGELSNEYLSQYINNHDNEKYNIDNTKWYDTLTKIYDKLKNGRPGNTIPNMIKVLENINNDIVKCSLKKKWVVGREIFSYTQYINIDTKLQKFIYIFDTIDWNPFVSVFNDSDYDLLKVLNHINTIYCNPHTDVNIIKSSDFYLQYLRKDCNNMWTNKHLYDKDVNVMVIDCIPSCISNEKDKITELITELKIDTYSNH